MYRANSANDVFAATPEIPEIDRWPPCSPFRNEKSTGIGCPDWSRPIGRPATAHLVDEQRRVARGAQRSVHRRAGFGRYPALGHRSQNLHVDGAHRLTGHRPLARDVARVAGRLGALDRATLLDDDPVVGHLARAVRQTAART